MIEKVGDDQLRRDLTAHMEETRQHVSRLERVFEMHGQNVRGADCPAIDGIIEEAHTVSGEIEDKRVLDAAIIANAQAVEHYEITRYGTLIAWARELGRQDCAAVLEDTLEEEKAADRKLTLLAESRVNLSA